MIVDTNVNLSRWPFRRVRGDDLQGLLKILWSNKVESAWAGSFDALLHKDVDGVNRRLVEDCRMASAGDQLVPFGCVNPTLRGWEEDFRRCHEVHRMPGIRLQPNYHGYTLEDSVFERLLRMADERKLIVQLCVKMEDERTQHPLLQVPPVDVSPLPKLLAGIPNVRLVILNGLRLVYAPTVKLLASLPNVTFDIGMLETVGTLSRITSRIPIERLLFGSYAPLFTFESALLKVREGDLNETDRQALLSGNARRLLGRK